METITLDANVIVSAFDRNDELRETCRELIDMIREGMYPVFSPTIFYPEIASGLRKASPAPELIKQFMREIRQLLFVRPVTIDERLAREAERIAIEYRQRGADSVYAATAKRYRAIVITNDINIAHVSTIRVMTPVEAHAHLTYLNPLAEDD